jgi:hypothetical protein
MLSRTGLAHSWDLCRTYSAGRPSLFEPLPCRAHWTAVGADAAVAQTVATRAGKSEEESSAMLHSLFPTAEGFLFRLTCNDILTNMCVESKETARRCPNPPFGH